MTMLILKVEETAFPSCDKMLGKSTLRKKDLFYFPVSELSAYHNLTLVLLDLQ